MHRLIPGRGDALDLLLLIVLVAYAVRGFRRGLLESALSVVGTLAGGWLGLRLGPPLATWLVAQLHPAPWDAAPLVQRLAGLFLVGAGATLGAATLVRVAVRARAAVHGPGLLVVDSAAGAVAQTAAVLTLCWALGTALATAPVPAVAVQVRHSRILALTDRLAPAVLRRQVADLSRLLQNHELPSPLAPLTPGGLGRFLAAPPPDAGVVPPALQKAGPSVVKIVGIAPSCDRRSEGSGFVYAPQHVITNAHVVAGTHTLTVVTPAPDASRVSAHVVLYDPRRDIAVLYVPELRRRPVPFAGAVGPGADAVVAGYPQDGPLRAVAARVRTREAVTGPDIYREHLVTRDVYTLRTTVEPGNSGGPLLSPSGGVLGVVFAKAEDTPETGYALTVAEVSNDASAGSNATAPVGTQGCD